MPEKATSSTLQVRNMIAVFPARIQSITRRPLVFTDVTPEMKIVSSRWVTVLRQTLTPAVGSR